MHKHVYKENFTHWHAHARKSISIFDINICTYIQIIYLYLYIINIYIYRYTYSQHVHGHWSGHSLWRECTPCHHGKLPALHPQCSLIWRASMHGDVPQQRLAIWFELVCTWGASGMITCQRELVVLDVKRGALGCLLNLFKICNKHVVWPRNK